VMVRLSVDKKRRGGVIRFVFCPAAGESRLVDVSPQELAPILRASRERGPKA